jgi:signal transduction histidine kinase
VAIVPAVAFSCGAHASRRGGLAAVAALAVCQQLAVGFSEFPNFEVYFATLGPWWVGVQVRRRRRLVSELAERTAQLEAEQDAFARLSVRRERARIARELHDIVAHHLAVIVVQAGAGRMAPATHGEGAAGRLRSIREAGDQALAEMSRLVDIIHADDGGSERGRDRLRALIDQVTAGGVDLEVAPLPPGVELPAEVEQDALRVVREGLTNAMKHAPGSRVHVRLALAGDALEVEVRDHGGGAPSSLAATGSRLGLTGMRERIESLGGSLDAGPDDAHGWRLRARLPTAPRPVAPAR